MVDQHPAHNPNLVATMTEPSPQMRAILDWTREAHANRTETDDTISYELTIIPHSPLFTGIGYKGWKSADVIGPDGVRRRMAIMLSEVDER